MRVRPGQVRGEAMKVDRACGDRRCWCTTSRFGQVVHLPQDTDMGRGPSATYQLLDMFQGRPVIGIDRDRRLLLLADDVAAKHLGLGWREAKP